MKSFFKYTRHRGIRKRVVSAVLIVSMVSAVPAVNGYGIGDLAGGSIAFASSAKDLKEQAEKDLENTNESIKDIENQQNQVDNDLDDAEQELMGLLQKQKKLKAQINDTQEQVDQANKDLAAAQKKTDEEYDSMKLRIQFMYENSADNSIWSAVLDSGGISDMLNRIEYISSMYKSDREMLDSYQAMVDEVEELTVQLNDKMDGLLAMQADYEDQQQQVETLIAGLNDKKEEYAGLLADAKEQAQEYQKTIEKQAKIIQQQEAEAARRALEEQRRREAAARAAALAAQAAQAAQEEQNNSNQDDNSDNNGGNDSSNDDDSSYEGGGAGASGLGGDASLTDPGADPAFSGDVSGDELVAYALQYVGNPYRWGGNSLTNGCDCSGFVHLVYQHFGYNLPRYSQSFKSVGQAVSYSNIKAGDIVVYPGHVAIYMGNGCIVEAQSTKTGITCNRSVDCHTITAIRRVL